MKKHYIIAVLLTTILANTAVSQTKDRFLDTLRFGFRYQVQEFHTLNQKLKEQENCNCDEALPLSKRAMQSISASLYEPLTSRWSVGADLGASFGTVMDDNRNYKKYNMLQMRVESFYHLFDAKTKLRPFLSGSMQLLANRNKAFFSLPLGAGLRYQLNKGATLHVQSAYDSGFGQAMAKNLISNVGFNAPLFKRKGVHSETVTSPSTSAPSYDELKTKKAENNELAQAKAPEAAQAGQAAVAGQQPTPAGQSKPTEQALAAGQDKSQLPGAQDKIAEQNQPNQQSQRNQAIEQLYRIVYFDTDKYDLNKSETGKVLAEVLAFMQKYPESKASLSGHTDGVLGNEYNLILSKNRVKAVAAWLRSKGISNDRIQTAFYGKSSPATSNDTPGGRAGNRRVEIKVVIK